MSAGQLGFLTFQALSSLGDLLVGGRVYTYEYGTTTHKTMYTDAAGVVSQTYTSDGLGGQYIALDARGELPAPMYGTTGSYDICLKTAAGATIWTRRGDPIDFSGSGGAALIGFIQAGTGAVAITAQAKMRQTVNIKDFGALNANSNAANKVCLQLAITALNAASGGVIVIDYDTCYGLDNVVPATWPDFSGCTKPIIIQDSSRGDTYSPAVYPEQYDGGVSRTWYFTPQTIGTLNFTAVIASGATSATLTGNWTASTGPWSVTFSNGDTRAVTLTNGNTTATWSGGLSSGATATASYTNYGNHDGNQEWLRADWAPFHVISNDANYAAASDPTRRALDNRRAAYACAVDGDISWQFGQGTEIGADKTNEVMSNWALQKFAITGDTLGSYSVITIERKTGRCSYGGGTNAPIAHHDFGVPSGAANTHVMALTSGNNTCTLLFRTVTGATQDYYIKNVSGSLIIHDPNVGDVATFEAATRDVGIGITPTVRLDVAKSNDSAGVSRIQNLGTTNGSVLNLTSATAAGTGFTLIEAYSGSADLEFKVRGDGEVTADGAFTGGGADYAEYFEWEDGNPNGEKHYGRSVALVDGTDKIRFAKEGDDILGIISANPSVVGNAAPMGWSKKYVRDEVGGYVMEACETVTWVEKIKTADAIPEVKATTLQYKLPSGQLAEIEYPGRPAEPEKFERKTHSYYVDEAKKNGIKIPAHVEPQPAQRRKLNPKFDRNAKYVPRSERKEWAPVGLLGRLPLLKGDPVASTWRKLPDISKKVGKWIVK